MIKALIKGHLAGAVNLSSRHGRARSFVHVVCDKAVDHFLNYVEPASIVWERFHPTRGDWAALADEYKRASLQPTTRIANAGVDYDAPSFPERSIVTPTRSTRRETW